MAEICSCGVEYTIDYTEWTDQDGLHTRFDITSPECKTKPCWIALSLISHFERISLEVENENKQ